MLYLTRFADQESRVYMSRFYKKYRGKIDRRGARHRCCATCASRRPRSRLCCAA